MKEKSLEIKRMHIKYIFTEDEKVTMAGELAEKMSEKDALNRQKKEIASKFTSQINTLDVALMKLSAEYRQGYTYKNHDCYEAFDYDTKQVFTYRADTDELVDIRTMTTAEFQRELFDPRLAIKGVKPIRKADIVDAEFDEDPPSAEKVMKEVTKEFFNDELIKKEK